MQKLDEKIAAALNEKHARAAEQINTFRRERECYAVGQSVWVVRPKSVGGCKTDVWWMGPARIESRSGEFSYQVELNPGQFLDVHHDQLKPCQSAPVPSSGIPLFASAPTPQRIMPKIVRVAAHCFGRRGQSEFLAHWEWTSDSLDFWEITCCCLSLGLYACLKYDGEPEVHIPLETLEVEEPTLIPTEVGGGGL